MKKLTIIFFCVLAAMLIAGKIFDSRYKKFWQPLFEKLDVVIKDTTYNGGIYLGDSRAHFGINPYYIDSATGLATYNIAIGGADIDEINFLARQYMAKHRPPIFAIISFDYSDILFTGKFFDNPCYYFFYTGDTATNNALARLGYHTTLYKFLPVLKYTAFDEYNKFSISENIKGNTFLKPEGVAYKGFINSWNDTFTVPELDSLIPEDVNIDNSIGILERTIQLFSGSNTLPIVVYPPATHLKPKAPVEIKIDSALAVLVQKHNLHVLHFDTDTSFTNDFFHDPWHLNLQGSVIYSQKLGNAIKTVLQNR